MAVSTTCLSIDLSRATASAICKSSSRLAATVLAIFVSWIFLTCRALTRFQIFLNEFVGKNQLRFHHAAEGKLDTLILCGDDDIVAIKAVETAAETLAAIERRGEFDPGFVALPAGEIADPRQRPVDPRRGNLDLVIAFDGILGFDEIEHGVRKLTAAFHIHAAVGA